MKLSGSKILTMGVILTTGSKILPRKIRGREPKLVRRSCWESSRIQSHGVSSGISMGNRRSLIRPFFKGRDNGGEESLKKAKQIIFGMGILKSPLEKEVHFFFI